MPEPIYFADADQWRAWLTEHHATADEVVVGFVKMGTGRAGLSNSEAVDQALCFGWIDGVVRRVDGERYAKRFTPRKPGSIWSRVNIEKVLRLREQGLMTEAGERAFAARRDDRTGVYAFEASEPALLDAAEQARFAAATDAWEFFARQAPWYRRTALHWVTRAKRADTRARRLATLIADSAEGRRLGHLSRDRGQ